MDGRITEEQFRFAVLQALNQGVRLDEIITAVCDVAFALYCSRHVAAQDESALEPGGGTFGGGGASGNW